MSTPGAMHPDQMQKSMKSAQRISATTTAGRRRKLAAWLCALAGMAVAIAAGAGLWTSHAQSSPEQDSIMLPQNTSTMPVVPSAQPPVVTLVAAKPPAGSSPAKQPGVVAPADEQKQQAVSQAADLLKMATALKTEVDKTTKDTLSITVVRKAGEIEQLAHKVRLGPGKG
jgi:type VI protein secretion system component VasF